ncbi:MAG TPA: MOSC domain-containing protein [Kofleriaceae bacterium]|nr:MOSC domain-containing protein [Kofleriaceae bacterium]
MRSREELESLWATVSLPRDTGRVRLIVARRARGIHDVLETAEVSPEHGLHGDRWFEDDKNLGYQITLMNVHVARLIRAADDQPLHTAGDNFLVDLDLGEDALPVGGRLRLGEALIEVTTDPHLGCKKFRERFGAGALAWVNDQANRAQRLRGVNCQVIEGGMISVGDVVRRADVPG